MDTEHVARILPVSISHLVYITNTANIMQLLFSVRHLHALHDLPMCVFVLSFHALSV